PFTDASNPARNIVNGNAPADCTKSPNPVPYTLIISPGANSCCPDAALLIPATANCVCKPWNGTDNCCDQLRPVASTPPSVNATFPGTFKFASAIWAEIDWRAGMLGLPNKLAICEE